MGLPLPLLVPIVEVGDMSVDWGMVDGSEAFLVAPFGRPLFLVCVVESGIVSGRFSESESVSTRPARVSGPYLAVGIGTECERVATRQKIVIGSRNRRCKIFQGEELLAPKTIQGHGNVNTQVPGGVGEVLAMPEEGQ